MWMIQRILILLSSFGGKNILVKLKQRPFKKVNSTVAKQGPVFVDLKLNSKNSHGKRYMQEAMEVPVGHHQLIT